MTCGERTGASSRALLAALALLVAFALLRFVGLEADFPVGLTHSFGPLTDEGYYAAPAVRSAAGQPAHQPGGFNSQILTPVSPFLQSLMFESVGVSLGTARLPSVVLSLALFALLVTVVWRRVGPWPAVVLGAVLTSHWQTFVYSRVALLDLPVLFFSVLAMVLMNRALERSGGGTERDAILAGFVLAVAALCKLTAVTVVPALLFVGWRGGKSRLRVLSLVGGTCAAVLSAWFAGVALPYRDDVMLFLSVNARSTWIGWFDEFHLLVGFAKSLAAIDPLAVVAVALALPWGVRYISAGLQGQRVGGGLYGGFWVFWASYLLFLVYSDYRPVRYLTPWLLLSVVLATWTATLALRSTRSEALAGRILVGVLCLQVVLGVARQGRELSRLEYGFRDAAREITLIAGDDAVLYGRAVQQVLLAVGGPAGATAVTEDFGTWSVERRIESYRPTHYMQFGPATSASRDALRPLGELVLLQRFPFLAKYGYDGVDAVYLYRVEAPLPLAASGR